MQGDPQDDNDLTTEASVMMVWPSLRVMRVAFQTLEMLAGEPLGTVTLAEANGCSTVTAHRALRWSRRHLGAPLEFARGPRRWRLRSWWSPPRVEFGRQGWNLRVGIEVDLSDVAVVEDLDGTFTYGGVVEGTHICGTAGCQEHCTALINRDVCALAKLGFLMQESVLGE